MQGHRHGGLAREVGQLGVRGFFEALLGQLLHDAGAADEAAEAEGVHHAQQGLLEGLGLKLADAHGRRGQRGREQQVVGEVEAAHAAGVVVPAVAGGGKIGGGVGAAQQAQQPGGGLHVGGPGGAAQVPGQRRDAGPGFAKVQHEEGAGHGLAIKRQRHFFHVVAQAFEQVSGGAHGRGALRVQGAPQRVPQAEADAQAAGRAAHFFQVRPHRGGQEVGCAHVGALGSIEQGCAVAHRAAEHVLDGRALPLFALLGAGGHPAPAGFQPKQAAAGRRNADGAAPIAGPGHGHDARRHGRRRPAAAAAGRVAPVPRVAGGAVQQRLGHAHQGKLGRVGFAHDVQARGLPAAHQLGIGFGHEAPQRPAARGVRGPGVVRPKVLQQKGHAAKRAGGQPGRGTPPGRLIQRVHHGVDLRVHGFGAGNGGGA